MNEEKLKQIIHESIINTLLEFDNNTKEQPLIISDFFDIEKISKSDIMSINNDMRIFLQGRGFGNSILYDGDRLLAEATLKTVPIGELRKNLHSLGFKKWQIESRIYANNVRVVILYADIAKNTDIIVKEMSTMGWNKVRISNPQIIHGVKCRAMDFDPSSQKDLTKEAHKFQFLYHITPVVNISSILSNGIEIRSENEYLDYPPRAHTIKGNATKRIVSYFGWQLFSVNRKNIDGKYGIIRLDTKKIPKTIKFYGDPRYQEGFISKENIPR